MIDEQKLIGKLEDNGLNPQQIEDFINDVALPHVPFKEALKYEGDRVKYDVVLGEKLPQNRILAYRLMHALECGMVIFQDSKTGKIEEVPFESAKDWIELVLQVAPSINLVDAMVENKLREIFGDKPGEEVSPDESM